MNITSNVFQMLQQPGGLQDEDLQCLAQLFGAEFDEHGFLDRLQTGMGEDFDRKLNLQAELAEKIQDIKEIQEAGQVLHEVSSLSLQLDFIIMAAKEAVERVEDMESAYRMFLASVECVSGKLENIFKRLAAEDITLMDVVKERPVSSK